MTKDARNKGDKMDFELLARDMTPLDEGAMAASRRRWNSIAKPVGSLGLLEEAVTQLAGLRGSSRVRLERRAALVMCADNGVVAEGVTQTGQEVTALVAGNMAQGRASINHMAALARAQVFPVDMGMARPAPGVADCAIARGTANFTQGPAMTPAQAEQAIQAGLDWVARLKDQGYHIIATGEMGIGNTTTSSAMASLLCGLPLEQVVGRGAGLSDKGLALKEAAISRAIAMNRPDPEDPFDVLYKLGGFDIAALTGVFLGGGLYRIPIIIDGFISSVAALTAARLCPACSGAMLASHVSAEPAARLVLEALDKPPLLCAGLRLGEGTGAICALPLLDMALAVYDGMASFDDIGLEPYEVRPQ